MGQPATNSTKFQKTFIEKYFLPKNIEDPKLLTALASMSMAQVSSFIVVGLSSFLWWYLDLTPLIYTSIGFLPGTLGGIVLMKWGFHRAARVLHMTNTNLSLVSSCAVLGAQSFLWVFLLTNVTAVLFITTEAEARLRRFLYCLTYSSSLLCLPIYYFKIYPHPMTETSPKAMGYLALFNVGYAIVLTLSSVLRHQRDVKIYKAKLQDQSTTRLQQSKMSTLGEMASGVALEINQPLTGIIERLDSMEGHLQAGALSNEVLQSNFSDMKSVVGKIAKTVSALRTYSRNAETDPFQTVRIGNIFEETLILCGESLRSHKIEVRLTGQQDLLVECRPTQICQVMLNLITNSLEAVQGKSERWIEISCTEVQNLLQVSVTDNGYGISEKVAEKIMQPFFTTKNSDKNTGLGLSICREFVQNHQGNIYLDRESKNTRFTLEIPRTQTADISQVTA